MRRWHGRARSAIVGRRQRALMIPSGYGVLVSTFEAEGNSQGALAAPSSRVLVKIGRLLTASGSLRAREIIDATK